MNLLIIGCLVLSCCSYRCFSSGSEKQSEEKIKPKKPVQDEYRIWIEPEDQEWNSLP